VLEGSRGQDLLDGGAGADRINGGFHPDGLRGGAGDDLILAQGGSFDDVDCGSGHDIAYIDSTDTVRGCEVIR
jgi:hypothetical protein